jgi:hypothetical protein
MNSANSNENEYGHSAFASPQNANRPRTEAGGSVAHQKASERRLDLDRGAGAAWTAAAAKPGAVAGQPHDLHGRLRGCHRSVRCRCGRRGHGHGVLALLLVVLAASAVHGPEPRSLARPRDRRVPARRGVDGVTRRPGEAPALPVLRRRGGGGTPLLGVLPLLLLPAAAAQQAAEPPRRLSHRLPEFAASRRPQREREREKRDPRRARSQPSRSRAGVMRVRRRRRYGVKKG